MAWLSAGKLTHELRDGEVVVGSGSEAAWRVPSADLMPRHFVLTVHGLNASVRPVSMDNVVVVNGQQLSGTPWTLHDGDVIAAGSGRFVYTDEAPRATPTPPAAKTSESTIPVGFLVDERANAAYSMVSRSTGIGRDRSNAIVIRDPTASRFHAEIRREAGGFVLHARGSAGTMVNNRQVASPCMLEEGDQIEIAYTVLRFTMQTPTAEQLAAVQMGTLDGSHRRPTPITDRMTSRDVARAARRGPSGLVTVVIVVLVVALWLWLR
jgi:pSer/pThr/pTyr-binding forkhead associated (FHA) protein